MFDLEEGDDKEWQEEKKRQREQRERERGKNAKSWCGISAAQQWRTMLGGLGLHYPTSEEKADHQNRRL